MGAPDRPVPWPLFLSEAIGTALLVLVGLSVVIMMFGAGSPIAPVVPNEALRRLITGFLFGTTGALIALSPIGRESGAHINPIVTLGFCLMGRLDATTAAGYAVAQLVGAAAGAPRFSCVVSWRCASRSQSSTTSIAIVTGSCAASPARKEHAHER